MSAEPLPLTGERTAPGISREIYWYLRHLACYRWAAERLQGSRTASGPILDAGAGEGYGSATLALGTGRAVLALELDAAASAHARRSYPSINVLRANLIEVPLREHSMAAIVSLQVIEHLWDVPRYLAELARCTRGPVIISTPNRPVHSPGLRRGERPINPFHVREFDERELRDELLAVAPGSVVVHGLHHGPVIGDWEVRFGSLPAALLSQDDQVRGAAEEFAEHLTEYDFVITNDDAASAHDLIAWWEPA